ncbi:MAG: hypothetical protein DRP69_04935 [Candidatus Duberdicusella sinuisediminis]|nr:MAG: hypothetical protein DRP69_04935 [Candidatus Omnitrophota bacterium]
MREGILSSIKKVGIVGAGKSGVSLAKLALSLGKSVKLSEINKDISFKTLKSLKQLGAEMELGRHTQDFFKDVDLVVLSPGVNSNDFYKNILAGLNIPWVGEIEFSFWCCKSKNIIAITGTNGKTTTTFIIGQVLKKSLNKRVYVLGNIGNPFSSEVLDIGEEDVVVLEVSSFQLETIKYFKPYIACLLNFSPDHLDRYSDLESYFLAKKRIFLNQDFSCYALFPKELEEKLRDISAQKICLDKGENLSFIEKILEILGVESSNLYNYLRDFKGLAHRLEFVAEKRGVKFINDSKATNILATIFALKTLKGKIILLAGGKDKNLDYSLIKPYLDKVKSIFLFGEAKDKIKKVLEGAVPLRVVKDLREAVLLAYQEAQSSDIILLSPMCSSFDMFKNYQERGEFFKSLVYELK